MEEEAAASSDSSRPSSGPAEEQVRVRRRTLEAVLEQCQRALELLKDADQKPDPAVEEEARMEQEEEEGDGRDPTRSPTDVDYETDELCDLLKSKVESSDFLEKLGSDHKLVYHSNADETASWDMVSAKDLWEDKQIDTEESNQEGYVLVRQEDIVEGIACFMAAYLISMKKTKELTPNQLQEALSKTFSVKKKKGKLRKAWDGSKVIYNVASWSATVIGIYQNPALLRVASAAFWTSCRVVSKLL